MNRKISLVPVISATFLLGASFAGNVDAVSCGEEVILDGKKVVLEADLSCNGFNPVLTIVGPGTFDMDGHTITCASSASIGVLVDGSRVKLLNGVVVGNGNCDDCVRVAGDGRHTIEGIVARGCENDDGFQIDSNRNTIKNSSAVGNEFGFYTANTSESNTIRDSQAVSNSEDGFHFSGTDHTVRDNSAIINEDIGFYVLGTGLKLQGNTSINNVSTGIRVFEVDTRLQKNRVLDNGGYDIIDDNFDCDDNKWSNNIFGTANRACVQ